MSRQDEREVECRNPECGKLINVRQYSLSAPDNADPDRVHVARWKGARYLSVLCITCGHYTVNEST